ncbi:similar to Saccharomyces cerevisiae YDL154W MSH5 Protein of the MutS family, forms a dimer with Msh4p that facilitates crossovers between homologs during meiosis [Maudiozyma saulgeensis]|uniref:Similar to Saccharomyces cerevisiae YDL154W MSH5 Protein of the MutS family, forms a dimer with Msh4p that facilitates crossovers between homologs during meiosis n=1 Tax=Maudiozyma saulgeensis TaxID=1789683 RepID=A0A1X7QXU9_9SACH|nr:similar to Saccharomyces cerevisiae YDL154W MSH5 Protein of the MutS family, forms a dimer with Msh4p that facilitates crossovers between homologs during meiosis [Kazachstania saulgeensis]
MDTTHFGTTYSDISHTPTTEECFVGGILFALDIKGKKLGCSILECSSKILKVLDHDYQLSISTNYREQLNGNISSYRYVDEINNLVELFFIQYRPTVFIVSSRMNPDSLLYIEKQCRETNCTLQLEPNELFNHKEKLNFGDSNLNADGGTLVKLLQNCDETLLVTISTVTAILNYLNKNSNNNESINSSGNWVNLQNLAQKKIIQYVDALSLSDRMLLDSNTISALNILPPIKYGQDKMIENGSFSIFQLFDRTSSTLAKHLLKNWLLFPLTNINDIKARSDIVKLFVQPTNSILFDDLKTKLTKCHNMYSVFYSLRDGNTTYRTWLYLHDFLSKGIEILYLLSSFSLQNIESSNVVTQMLHIINIKDIRNMKAKIESVINIEETSETKNMVLIQGLDDNLDKYHQEFRDIELILEDKAFEEEQNIKNYLSGLYHKKNNLSERFLNIIYIPQMGYLAALPKVFPFQEILSSQFKWHLTFDTSTTLYFTTSFTQELDESYGDVYSFILDLEVEIIHELQEYILSYEKDVLYFYRKIAELDILSSFATTAQLFSYTEPILTEDNCCINIIEGRHPLYESIVESYIPNSLELIGGNFKNTCWQDNENQRIVLLSGANGSGKTVFLTQIGLIVYLAHIGSFVPATRTEIGITDRIFTRIHSKESLLVNRSSFENDTMQMSSCMSLCTEKSLLLIDEFGKGTDSIDGPALFGSIIKYFSESTACPRVVACTHFSELFQKDVLSTDIRGVQFLQTEVFISNETKTKIDQDYSFNQQNNVNIFLYSIAPGLSTDSLGILCAKVCGMKETIIKRASELSRIMKNGENITQYCSTLMNEEIEAFERDQQVIKEFLAWDLDLEFTTSEYGLLKKLKAILKGHKVQRDLFQAQ